jgi:hypothetical protein
MTAALDRPLRARACVRAMIYRVTIRARRTPPYHPLRLQLEDELAELTAQLAEVEQRVGGVSPLKRSKMAAPSEPDRICDVSLETGAAPATVGDAACMRAQETGLSWTPSRKYDLSEALQARLTASSAAKERRARLGALHGARVSVAHAGAAIINPMRRMLETVVERIISFGVIVLRTPIRCLRHVPKAFDHGAVVTELTYRRSVLQALQVMADGSRLLRRRIGKLAAYGNDFLTSIANILRRAGDRLVTLLDSCAGAAADQRRRAGAVARTCSSVVLSFVHQASHALLAANWKLRRAMHSRLFEASARISLRLGRWRAAIEGGKRRAYAAAMQGVATSRRLLQQHIQQRGSRWAESFARVVAPRIADDVRTAADAGRGAAKRAWAAGSKGINAGRLFLKTALATAAVNGRNPNR